MAIIYSYPHAVPTINDMVLGARFRENEGISTNSFYISDIVTIINDALTIPTLQEVTGEGANTTVQMQINGVNIATVNDIPLQIVKIQKTTITPAQVRQLFTTPATVLTAASAGKINIPINMYIRRNAGTAYTLNTNTFQLLDSFGTDTNTNINPNPLTSGSVGYINNTINLQDSITNANPTTPYKLKAVGGNPLEGSGNLDVYVTYIEITL